MFSLYMHVAPNGKTYIGITSKRPVKRWANGDGYRYNTHFYSAIKKYGWNKFEHIIIISNLTKEQAKQLEIDFIKGFDSSNQKMGYNITSGGNTTRPLNGEENGMYGKTHSIEARTNISNKAKERFKDKTNHPMYGKPRSDETKRKLSEINKGLCSGDKNYFWGKSFKGEDSPSYGVPKSEETKKKISESRKGRFMGKDAHNARKIINKTTGEVFDCAMDIKRKYGISNSSVGYCCRGIYKECHGYEFAYCEDNI